jgi:hypothetical protein
MRCIKLITTVSILFLGAVETAVAGGTAGIESFTNPSVWPNADNQDFNLGYSFRVSSPMTVTALGYNYFGVPLNASHQVGIYDSNQDLLASATVDNSSTPFNSYLYTSLGSPLDLSRGTYYIVGTTLGQNDGYIYAARNLVTAPGVTFLRSWFSDGNGGTLSFPDLSSPNGYFVANFLIGAGAVPEPTSGISLAIGIGMAGVCGYAWRRRKSRPR